MIFMLKNLKEIIDCALDFRFQKEMRLYKRISKLHEQIDALERDAAKGDELAVRLIDQKRKTIETLRDEIGRVYD